MFKRSCAVLLTFLLIAAVVLSVSAETESPRSFFMSVDSNELIWNKPAKLFFSVDDPQYLRMYSFNLYYDPAEISVIAYRITAIDENRHNGDNFTVPPITGTKVINGKTLNFITLGDILLTGAYWQSVDQNATECRLSYFEYSPRKTGDVTFYMDEIALKSGPYDFVSSNTEDEIMLSSIDPQKPKATLSSITIPSGSMRPFKSDEYEYNIYMTSVPGSAYRVSAVRGNSNDKVTLITSTGSASYGNDGSSARVYPADGAVIQFLVENDACLTVTYTLRFIITTETKIFLDGYREKTNPASGETTFYCNYYNSGAARSSLSWIAAVKSEAIINELSFNTVNIPVGFSEFSYKLLDNTNISDISGYLWDGLTNLIPVTENAELSILGN